MALVPRAPIEASRDASVDGATYERNRPTMLAKEAQLARRRV